MTINALFGVNPNRESQSTGDAKSGIDGSTFAASLAASMQASQQAQATQADTSTQANTSPSSASNAASSTASATTASNTDTSTVALGADAKGLSELAADGVTVSVQSLAGLDLPQGLSPSSATYQQDLLKALNAAPHESSGDTLSQSAFVSLIEQFGGTQTQADQLFSQLGGTDSGTVSNAQMLDALGQLSSDPSSTTSQMLLSLMDSNHNQVVSSSEFMQFETAMVDAENGVSTVG
ncbi:hypothetical protein [Pararobbsia silviterrae]|uniref:EF-hand domain-containing protein n=1 Tax=Pararobbsia silviterrae TaxID=1792498 RepID=A0A494XGT0_9BURK|nr:hypothetical protein [Pararobbsia silviterrae]RKP47796.1 hypothetical protein D7S86_22850 [Pararobbsia silviterrae]